MWGSRRSVAGSPWTKETIANLKERWSEGYSAGMIASQMGISRSAVMGQVHRLGLARKKTAIFSLSRTNKNKPDRKWPTGVAYNPTPKQISGTVYIPYKPKPVEVPPPLHLGIMETTGRTCKWPYGEKLATTYCGHATREEGGPYCPAHYAIAHAPEAYTPFWAFRGWKERADVVGNLRVEEAA